MNFQRRSFFTLALLIVLLMAVIGALGWPLRANILILLLVGTGVIILGIQLFKEIFTKASPEEKGSGMDVVVDESQKGTEATKRTIAIWSWIIGLAMGIWLFSFAVSVPLFAFLYSLLNVGRWYWSLFIGFLSFALLYGIFEMVIHAPWPEPLLLELIRG